MEALSNTTIEAKSEKGELKGKFPFFDTWNVCSHLLFDLRFPRSLNQNPINLSLQ
jgi:hypothetical protein